MLYIVEKQINDDGDDDDDDEVNDNADKSPDQKNR